MPDGKEIERKWLVNPTMFRVLSLEGCTVHEVKQGYVHILRPEGVQFRLRQIDEDYLLTAKQKTGDAVKRDEINGYTDREVFETMWPLTRGNRVVKKRYDIPDEGRILELDIFEGNLAPLIMAEREFDFDEEARLYKPLAWIGPEVTADKRYKNDWLAKHGLPEDFPYFPK